MTKISITMLVYEKTNLRYLSASLNSILNQTFTDWELIIADGCNDNREQLIKYLTGFDTRVRYIKQGFKGFDGAFNLAYLYTEGDIICSIGDDDIYEDTFLAKAYDAISSGDNAISYCDVMIIDNRDNVLQHLVIPDISSTEPISGITSLLFMKSQGLITHSSMCSRRRCFEFMLDNLPLNQIYLGDFPYYSVVMGKFKSIKINDSLVKYRVHNNMMSFASSSPRNKQLVSGLKSICSLFKPEELLPFASDEIKSLNLPEDILLTKLLHWRLRVLEKENDGATACLYGHKLAADPDHIFRSARIEAEAVLTKKLKRDGISYYRLNKKLLVLEPTIEKIANACNLKLHGVKLTNDPI